MDFKIKISILLAVSFCFFQANAFFIHEEAQEVDDDSDIVSIKIAYNENITSTHLFPETFWVEVKSRDDNEYKFEFDLIDDPSINTPVNLWKTELNGKAYKLHRNSKGESHESWATYQLVGSDNALGVATLIRNGKSSNKASKKHRNLFRMIGSITYENNFIEILPYITREQQDARKKRSADNQGEFESIFDEFENSHMIRERPIPKFEFAEPIMAEIAPIPIAAEVVQKSYSMFDSLRKKRQTSKTQYYVEVLAVLDLSDYNLHQTYYQITDSNTIHSYMRMYYSHMFFTVNNFFQYSFANDATANFNIVLTNMLFIEDTTITTWTNPSIVGRGTQNNGRDLLDANLALNNFASVMTTRSASLPFTYDMAVAIANKDLYSGGNTQVAGIANFAGVCSNTRYVMTEDFGGAMAPFIVAHEIGHNLGAEHDGTGSSSACPASNNNIMTPGFGVYQTSLTNNYLFSSCSMTAFKNLALTKTCLSNVPTPTPDLALVAKLAQGQIFDANAQCRLYYGPNAIYAQVTDQSLICSALFCASSVSSIQYWSNGEAMEGTSCGSGMWCSRGSCVSNSSAPTGTCLYGDFALPSGDNTYGVTCDAGLQYYSTQYSMTLQQLCTNPYFSARCCSTCKTSFFKCLEYSSMTSCANTFSNCDSFKQYCGTSVVLSGGSISGTTDTLCPVTCGKCSTSATCALYGSLCQNGATCSNNANGQNGFKCICPSGYYGGVCEYKYNRYNIAGEQALYSTGTTTTSKTSSTTTRTSTSTTTTRTTTTSTTTRTTTTTLRTTTGTCICSCTTPKAA